MVYGSLHFITFDGTDYSFKALGEFVILRLSSSSGSNIFTLQGQTDKLQTDAKAPEMVRMAAFHQGIGKVSLLLKINSSVNSSKSAWWKLCYHCISYHMILQKRAKIPS